MKISIIIPTRERADYLPHAIGSATDIEDDDIEIIVCDNFSQDHTPDILGALTDSRVTCVNTGKRLAMRENFNHAVNASTGEYLIVFGDDDAIVPGQFRFLRRILEAERPDGMSWPRATYGWPVEGYGKKTGGLRFYRHGVYGAVRDYDPKHRNRDALLRCALADIAPVTPNIYHGCVSRAYLDRVAPKPGVFFDSSIPDVNFEYRTILTGGHFVHADHPFTISGHSPVSTGGSHHRGRTDAEGGEAGRAFLEENRTDTLEDAFDYALTIPMVFFATLETLIARMGYTECSVDHTQWYRYALSAEPGNAQTTARIDSILTKHAEKTDTTDALKTARALPKKPKRTLRARLARLHAQAHSFRVSTAMNNENTVLTAARICDDILGDDFGVVLDGQSPPRRAWAAARRRSKRHQRQF